MNALLILFYICAFFAVLALLEAIVVNWENRLEDDPGDEILRRISFFSRTKDL